MKWRQILNFRQLPLVVLAGALLPFFVLLFFTYPASDDYSFFADTQSRSFLAFINWGYYHLSGRYTAIAITKLFNPLSSQSFWVYRLFTAVIFFGFTHSAYLFLKQAAKRIGIKENTSLIAVIMLLYLWLVMPNVCELVYWYSSSYSYTIGLIGLFYWGYFLLQEENNTFDKSVIILLPILIAGTCEVAGILLLFVMASLVTYHVVNKIKPPIYYYAALGVALLAIATAFLAPGNFHRNKGIADLFTGTPMHDFGFAFNATFDKSVELIFDYFLLNLFTLFIVLVLAAFTPTYNPTEEVKKLAKYMLFASLGIVPVLLFPYYWSTGLEFIPLRIINYCFIGFSLLYIPALFIFYKPFFSSRWQSKKVKYTLLLTTFILIGLRSNIRYALTDLYHINTYKTEVENRYAVLKHSRVKDVEFTPLTYKPNTILHTDLDAKPGHWYNRGLAAYYGVNSISVKK